MKYRHKSPEVDAFQYQLERLDQLPDWAKKFRGQSALNGETGIARNPVGDLLVPVREAFAFCRPGDWLVFDENEKTITVLTTKQFEQSYEPVVEPISVSAKQFEAANEPDQIPVVVLNEVATPPENAA